MAPLKKTKSAPHVTKGNFLKALKRNNKVESEPVKKKAVQSCPKNSSPESVKKKTIFKNLKSKLSKKKK